MTACRLRPAEPDDALILARLILIAGAGVYEFQLEGLFGDAPLEEVLASGICGASGNFSHRQMIVAVDEDDDVIGAIHGHPTVWMRDMDRSLIPADRLAHLSPFDAVQDWDSYFISALAVFPTLRRRGVAARLVAALAEKASTGGFSRLSLHVWADNAEARAFYAAQGFIEAGGADIPFHPRLPHHGGSKLLLRDL